MEAEKTSVMGRPRKEIDFDDLRKMCEIHCTQEEICHLLDMHHETLNARIQEKYGCTFSQYYKKNSSTGKKSLRRTQYDAANSGSVPMMIWLGKQYLGQSDKNEVKETRRSFELKYDPDEKPE